MRCNVRPSELEQGDMLLRQYHSWLVLSTKRSRDGMNRTICFFSINAGFIDEYTYHETEEFATGLVFVLRDRRETDSATVDYGDTSREMRAHPAAIWEDGR